MYNDNTAPRTRLLSLLVAVACSGLCATAAADPTITLMAQYALNGAAPADAMPEGSTFTTADGSDFYMAKSEGGSGVFFHAYGFTGASTNFGARASGNGLDFYAKTSSLYSGTYTNTTGSATLLNFSFNVDAGEVALYGSGVGSANLLLRVRRNGTVVSQGDTTVTQTASGITCTESDIGSLGAWGNCSAPGTNYVSGNSGAYSVDLGLVGAGETVTIDYDIVSTVSGQYVGGAVSSGNCYGGYARNDGYGNAVEQPFVPCVSYNGIARSGDPFGNGNLGNAADFSINATAAALPEPGSFALLAAAGGGWWLSRRRRSGPAAG